MTAGPTPDHAFIEFVHRQRAVVGGVLLALAVGCLVGAGYCGYRGLKDQFNRQDETAAEVAPPPAADAEPVELEPWPYRVGMVVALVAALGLGAVGAYFLGKVPDADPACRRRTDRILLLVVGYVFGLANRACGLFLFYHWFSKLTDWLNGEPGGHKTGWMPVAALLQYLLGAGVTFLASLPARAEERNQPLLRRAVYATNFALSAVLLVVGLVLVNAVVAMKLPAHLDTTPSGFYTLTDETTKYLSGLKQPIDAYLITPDVDGDRVQADTVRLLEECQRVNPQRFKVHVYSATVNAAAIRDLQQKYKAAELREPGVLLTAGPDGERFELVPLRRMVTATGRDRSKVVFNGEAQLVGGMMSLTEERTTVYYTRGSGELTLERSADPAASPLSRPAFRLQDALAATQCEARPLAVGPLDAEAKVPDDAAMVIVLDPLTTLPPATVAAIQRYMTAPRPGNKKGKLLVFAGAHNVPAGNTLATTGLEPVLSGMGIDLVDRAVYTRPIAENAPPDVVIVRAGKAAVEQRNPVALAASNGLITTGARPVRTSPDARGTAQPILGVSTAGFTWLEKGVIDPPMKALNDLLAADQRRNTAYLQERQVTNQNPPSVAVITTDSEGKPVAAVFGFADGLSDEPTIDDGGRAGAVFKASVGWLRERPPAPDITPKEYAEYTPKKGVSENMLFWVPVCGTLLTIVAIGLGVWAVRRK
jgi:hypothetical protein